MKKNISIGHYIIWDANRQPNDYRNGIPTQLIRFLAVKWLNMWAVFKSLHRQVDPSWLRAESPFIDCDTSPYSSTIAGIINHPQF